MSDGGNVDNRTVVAIWDCMNMLARARESTNEIAEEDDRIVDASHVCCSNCDMQRIRPEVYRCQLSGNVHVCGDRCKRFVVGKEYLTCKITGVCIGVDSALNFKGTDADVHGGSRGGVSSTCDGFEIIRVRTGSRDAKSKRETRVQSDSNVAHMRAASEGVIRELLWSRRRAELSNAIGARHGRIARRRMFVYVRQRTSANLPIVLTELQNLFVSEMQRTDGWICNKPPNDDGRVQHLIAQCLRVQLTMQKPAVRSRMQSPIFQLSAAMQNEYFALATLYILRDGIRGDNDEYIVQRDRFLNKYLPNLNSLNRFAYKKSRFSHATACIKMALNFYHKNRRWV